MATCQGLEQARLTNGVAKADDTDMSHTVPVVFATDTELPISVQPTAASGLSLRRGHRFQLASTRRACAASSSRVVVARFGWWRLCLGTQAHE
jgi:hypothetical protein